jgi:lipopolysaccharide biosynthesis glycosyltransferase
VQLVFCVDSEYAMPLAVTLKSIERSQAGPGALEISVFTAGFTAEHEDAVRQSVPELSLEFVDVDRHLPRDLPQMKWFTRAAYGRLVAPTLLGHVDGSSTSTRT